jgi:hypothetical protein
MYQGICGNQCSDRRTDPRNCGQCGISCPAATASCAAFYCLNQWATWPMPNSADVGLPNPQSYDTSTPGIVIDNVTGLTWQKTLNGTLYAWSSAKRYCDDLGLAGFTDWRLPSRIELVSLSDFMAPNVPIDGVGFPGTPPGWFWSSSAQADYFDSRDGGWIVNFSTYAGAQPSRPDFIGYVRCVRGGSGSQPAEHYTIKDGLVHDNGTGLTWQQSIAPGTYNWNDAGAYCRSLADGGGAFRLPTLNELQTIVDETAYTPSINTVAFPNTPLEYFWTSSLVPGRSSAFVVNFDRGYTDANQDATQNQYRARCVR